MNIITPISLLIIANFFMTYAWYGHLKNLNQKPLLTVILISWGIAFFEYCLQVPANRLGFQSLTLSQLKIIQEVITLIVFTLFSTYYMGIKPTLNFAYASLCILAAVYFIFQDVK